LAHGEPLIADFNKQVKGLYDSSVPFFTSEALKDISRQIDEASAAVTPGDHVEATFMI
jgi:hypothetical protein